jgi:hypothetical protein
VEYSCPRPRVYTGTRGPEEAGTYRSCGSSPTCQVDLFFSSAYRKNSKNWRKFRAQLFLFRLAPLCPRLLQLQLCQRNHLRRHPARAPPHQFPVASNANSRIVLLRSPTRKGRGRFLPQPVVVVAYRRHRAKYTDPARQKRVYLARALDHSKSSAL